MFDVLKDILSPKKCYSCGIEWHFLCEECYNKIEKYKPFCYVCKSFSKNFEVHKKCKCGIYYDRVVVLTHYKQKTVKKLIKDAKFYLWKDILKELWIYMWKFLINNLDLNNNNILLSVPIHFFRRLKRWYNQSEILAENICKITNLELKNNIIKKLKYSRQQSTISREKRLSNLDNSFIIDKKQLDKVDKKNYIIVDDVVSTWTTVNEISKLLKDNWAALVTVIAFSSD